MAAHGELAGRSHGAAGQADTGAGWRRGSLTERLAGKLDAEAEREFGQALDRSLSDALPALGLVFGIGVLLFSAWDYWIDSYLASTTLFIRLTLVLLGAAGYVSWGGRLPVAWRCALVYVTHAAAMVLSSALLPGGLVLAMPAITGAMFPLALVEPRLPRLAGLVLLPSLLFLLLGAQVLPPLVFASCAVVYGVVLVLVAAVALFQGRLLRADFLAERALAWSARHDSLSGVLARGYLIELAAHDLAAARRYGRPLAIAMLDIDHFKAVNDRWGHAVGDSLLCAVSRACSAELRASDYFGRVGGEEFVCVMPETGEEEALNGALHDQSRGRGPGCRGRRFRRADGRRRRRPVPRQGGWPRPHRAGGASGGRVMPARCRHQGLEPLAPQQGERAPVHGDPAILPEARQLPADALDGEAEMVADVGARHRQVQALSRRRRFGLVRGERQQQAGHARAGGQPCAHQQRLLAYDLRAHRHMKAPHQSRGGGQGSLQAGIRDHADFAGVERARAAGMAPGGDRLQAKQVSRRHEGGYLWQAPVVRPPDFQVAATHRVQEGEGLAAPEQQVATRQAAPAAGEARIGREAAAAHRTLGAAGRLGVDRRVVHRTSPCGRRRRPGQYPTKAGARQAAAMDGARWRRVRPVRGQP